MRTHYCLSPDYPGGRIVCMCARGQDHDEALFDVPLDAESG